MRDIAVQQALFFRGDDQAPELRARSAGFLDAWRADAERVIAGFGKRCGGIACPETVFALPLNPRQVAVVRVAEQPERQLAFHFLALDQASYHRYAGDPFVLARRLPATWDAHGELRQLAWPAVPAAPRTVAEVQAVLRRVKAAALLEDEDPESPMFARTADNSESPALLGGAQVLVDGGHLVFVRPQGDLTLLESLWTLLPDSTRCRIWPASFAFGNDLGFDVVVLPQRSDEGLEGYTTEEQAADYPQGSFELALQTAAEAGDQRALDAAFARRNSGEMVRLALALLAGMVFLVIGSRWFVPHDGTPGLSERQQKAAAAAGIVAAGEPWLAAGMLEYGQQLWTKR